MNLKRLEDRNIKDKAILYRAPYDIDTEEVDGVPRLVDDMRIVATLPTLQYLLKENCKIVVLNYVGRPDGQVVESLRTTLHAKRLSELLGRPVAKVDECIGGEVDDAVASMAGGDILMLENVRFHPEEMVDDDVFAKELCKGKDLIVFDGFPQALRIHASTTGIERHLPAVAGLYLSQEVAMLSNLLENPKHSLTVIIGGAKISDKIGAISNLLSRADNILVGGGVANVFMKAQGRALGDSFIEDVFVDKAKREKKDLVEEAKRILAQAKDLGKNIMIPKDLVITDDKDVRTLADGDVPSGWSALDIGPESVKDFVRIVRESQTIFMNGPMGKFEDERFSSGSQALIEAMQKVKKSSKENSQTEVILAGGDTINLARRHGSLDDYSHVSLAGGATLEFLAGKELPALLPLMK
jgi:phosphoglycerate kinase